VAALLQETKAATVPSRVASRPEQLFVEGGAAAPRQGHGRLDNGDLAAANQVALRDVAAIF
jgi:hypothetical protein